MRVFWLGMHKVLVGTELPRLRSLGYEVFNPPYLSDVVDQSAVIDWENDPGCTLPAEVVEKLSSYNFYYNQISPEIAELLNEWFDAIIVTINPDWLVNILKAYRGKVIYRVFGQPYSLSEHFRHHDLIPLIAERDNFFFVPHHQLTAAIEHEWLLERSQIVPYCLSDDVFPFRDTWNPNRDQPQVGLLCPRIENPYYASNYTHLKHYFPGELYPIFGMQMIETDDPQIVGSIDRTELLKRFQRLCGFYYHYKEESVAYLPPLEFMTIGGPVLAKQGSLLARYFGAGAPNVVNSDIEADQLAKRLMSNDEALISEMIAAQETVRRLYSPEYVWPIFDKTFKRLLDADNLPAKMSIFGPGTGRLPAKLIAEAGEPKPFRIVVLFHRFGPFVSFQKGQYNCSEGVAKVARVIVKALAAEPDGLKEVIVTCYRDHLQMVHGFFRSIVENERVRINCLVVDRPPLMPKIRAAAKRNRLAHSLYRRLRAGAAPAKAPASLAASAPQQASVVAVPQTAVGRAQSLLKLGAAHGRLFFKNKARILRENAHRLNNNLNYNYKYHWFPTQREYTRLLNRIPDIEAILIPHYYLFPEAKHLRARKILYLPDHMPYLMEKGTFPDEELNNRIGSSLAAVSDRVLTNSRYSADYLPECPLAVPPSRLAVFPLPNLVLSRGQDDGEDTGAELLAEYKLRRHRYIFYPTQNRPNKRLGFLVEIVNLYNDKYAAGGGQSDETLDLLLTCPPSPELRKSARSTRLSFAVNRNDNDIETFYRNALCLAFTSVLEGNFPTQVKEALIYRTPVVATDLPLITRELQELSEDLGLCDRDQPDCFVEAIRRVKKDRKAVLEKQERARAHLEEHHSMAAFTRNVNALFRLS